jgi:hypothetical protein
MRAARIGIGLATPTFLCLWPVSVRGASGRCFSARVGARKRASRRRRLKATHLRKAGSCRALPCVVPCVALRAGGSELTSHARSLVAFSLAQVGRCVREQKCGRRVGDQAGTQGIAVRASKRFSRLSVGASVLRARASSAPGFVRVVGVGRSKQNAASPLSSSSCLRPCLRSAA